MRRGVAALAGAAALLGLPAPAAPLASCHLEGVEHDARCGTVRRPLDPAHPEAGAIDVHFAVLPALARRALADPVFFFAGGPGQSAIDLAGQVAALLARFSNRRDIVLVDQRGTGRSAPLDCGDDAPGRPLAESLEPARLVTAMQACRERLRRFAWGDLRQFTTSIAVGDFDAVRAQLGAERIDLVGMSYGTRVALEYLRQFPGHVRRVVLDGVVPPSLVLPESGSIDAGTAFDALIAACAADAGCRARNPDLRSRWQALLATLPRRVVFHHPLTGVAEPLVLTREMLLGLVRAPLYVPALASALPAAIDAAAEGRFDALVGLASALGGSGGPRLAQGEHFSVVCAEDAPRMAAQGAGFDPGLADVYRRICADWPRAELPAGFFTMPPAPVAVLLLSGGDDPATPPRHAEAAARALGPKARSVVVAHAGHGLLGLACLRDTVFRFVDATSDAEALAVDADCARDLPRPAAFEPVQAAGAP